MLARYTNKKLFQLFISFLFGAIFVAQTSFAAGYESVNHLHEITKDFITQHVQLNSDDSIDIKINSANSPLNVHACASEISAAFPANGNNEQATSIQLSCNDSQPWQIYVPVDIQIFTNVIVAKHNIAAKETISEDSLELNKLNKNHLYNGYFTKKEDIIGNESTHLITTGTVLTKNNIHTPIIVHRNQSIALISRSNTVSVTMQGIAKEDGSLNSSIKIFNPSSKKTVDAIVVGPNRAEITA